MEALKGIAFVMGGLVGMRAVGSAEAQCAPTDKIYVDPKLVPKPLDLTRSEFMNIMLHGSPQEKEIARRAIMQRGQPIVIPYGTGKVLVHPSNPCVQQYIP